MHLVAENGHSVCLKWLVDAGATVAPLTKDNETPLHWAAWKGQAACCRQLVEAVQNTSLGATKWLVPNAVIFCLPLRRVRL